MARMLECVHDAGYGRWRVHMFGFRPGDRVGRTDSSLAREVAKVFLLRM
jgi:hypothetical protein